MTVIIKGLPPKVKLAEKLNATGGISTLTKNEGYKPCFDDTKTIVFQNVALSAGGVSYPLGIESGSYVLRNSEMSSSVYADGTVRKGIGDAEADFSITQLTQTFSDSAINIDYGADSKESKFYLTGSELEEFQQPLLAKNKIEIDIPIGSDSVIGLTSGSIQFIGYHNFQNGTVEAPSTTFSWFDNVAFTGATYFVETSAIGFGPSCGSNVQETIDQYGLPIDLCAFPHAPKYQPSEEQLLSLADYIDRPFMVEKVKLEFHAKLSMGETPNSQAIGGVAVTNFFILTQRPRAQINSVTTEYLAGSNSLRLATVETYPDNNERDILTFGRIASRVLTPGSQPPGLSTEEHMDLVIVAPSSSTNVDAFEWSGQNTLLMDAKAPLSLKANGTVMASSAGHRYLTKNTRGGRNGLGKSTGRDTNPVNPQPGTDFFTNDNGGEGYVSYPPYNSTPYLLQPSDKLVLGWQVPLPLDIFSLGGVETGSTLTFKSGKWKLTLYGSYVKKGKEFHEIPATTLSSVTVHETIGTDPCLDEFQTEPKEIFYNSYTDWIFTKNRTDTFFSEIVNHNVGVVASYEPYSATLISEYALLLGNRNTNKNMAYRFLQYSSEVERYYDSVLPQWSGISAINGATLVYSKFWTDIFHATNLDGSNYIVKIILNTDGSTAISTTSPIQNVSDNTWRGAYFFDDVYATVPRDPDIFTTKTALALGATEEEVSLALVYSPSVNPSPLAGRKPIYLIQLKSYDGSNHVQVGTIDYAIHFDTIPTIEVDSITNPTQTDFAKLYFGYRSRTLLTSNAPESGNYYLGSAFGVGVRGWRYGILNGVPAYSKSIYNKNRYGQFRDRLEQRQFAKFYDMGKNRTLNSPVIVKFAGDPDDAETGYNFVCFKEARVKKPFTDRGRE